MSEGALFGRVALSDTLPPDSGLTQDILRLVPKRGELGAVYAFLSSDVGQTLIRSAACGTSIPILRLDLLRNLPLPELDTAVKSEAERLVSEALEAWQQAADAEASATRVIEEEVLPQWLE